MSSLVATKVVIIEPIVLPMALGVSITLGIRFLIHVKLVIIATGAVHHMVIVPIVAPLEDTLRVTMATSPLLEEEVAVTILVRNLGRPVLMVQRIEVRDSRLKAMRILEDVIMVTKPHYHLNVVKCLGANIQPHSLHSLMLARIITEAGKTLARTIAMRAMMIGMVTLGAQVVATGDDTMV